MLGFEISADDGDLIPGLDQVAGIVKQDEVNAPGFGFEGGRS